MFSRFHISDNGRALCHEGILMVNFEEALWMNPTHLCPDCRRRFVNITKMLHIENSINPKLDKKMIRELIEEINL